MEPVSKPSLLNRAKAAVEGLSCAKKVILAVVIALIVLIVAMKWLGYDLCEGLAASNVGGAAKVGRGLRAIAGNL